MITAIQRVAGFYLVKDGRVTLLDEMDLYRIRLKDEGVRPGPQ